MAEILAELGIIIIVNDKTVTWDTDTIPMKDRGTLYTQASLIEVYLTANEPQTLVDEFSRSTKILDADCKPVVLNEIIKMCENLNQEEQHQLLQILQKYEHLFDVALGECNMEPISLHLMDKGSKPVHARLYTVPRSGEQQLRKEIARLVEIGVLEEDYTSEWASPKFAIAKKKGSQKTQFLIETSPISDIKDWGHDLFCGSFTFAMALDLNMG